MSISRVLNTLLLSGSMLAGLAVTSAFAADVEAGPLPAVSGINGKIEFAAGISDADAVSSDGVFYGAGAISIPLGDTFGLQADFAVVDAFDETAVGGALHLFTRDPNQYLFGAIGGYADFGAGETLWGGAEAEIYLDQISIEAVAGVMDLDAGNVNSTELFAVADVALYATDDLRLSVGASSIAGFETAGVGMEWALGDIGLPISFTADARIGEDDFIAAKAGFTIYFGSGSEKSLKDRHRQDDPRIRSFIGSSGLDIFGAGGVLDEECTVPEGGGEMMLTKAPAPVDSCGVPIAYDK